MDGQNCLIELLDCDLLITPEGQKICLTSWHTQNSRLSNQSTLSITTLPHLSSSTYLSLQQLIHRLRSNFRSCIMIPIGRNDLFLLLRMNNFDSAPEDPKFRLRKHEHKASLFITLQRAHCESGGKFSIVSDRKTPENYFVEMGNSEKYFYVLEARQGIASGKDFIFGLNYFVIHPRNASVPSDQTSLSFLRDSLGLSCLSIEFILRSVRPNGDNEDNIQQP